MSDFIGIVYEIKFTCSRCKKMYVTKCLAKQDDNYFVSGLLCSNCSNQTTLELDFDV